MAQDSGIVTIYDLENGGEPLQCHRIDAKEFLQSPRWSTSPEGKEKGDAPVFETEEDSGKAILLKANDFKTLRAMAEKANIPDYMKMNKGELVEALLAVK